MKTFQSTAYVLVIALSFFGTSCKKDKNDTTAYKNNFALAVTGSSWTASSVSATVNEASNAIVITASGGGQKIDIYISKDISSGTEQKIYTTTTVPSSTDLANSYYSIGSFIIDTKTFSNWGKTSVKITEHDKTNKIIKGRFTGGGVFFSDNSSSLVSGGGFDINY
ncbi:MAG: hypothetical protein ABI675_12240 [Chitinophagaceae bacterium]